MLSAQQVLSLILRENQVHCESDDRVSQLKRPGPIPNFYSLCNGYYLFRLEMELEILQNILYASLF